MRKMVRLIATVGYAAGSLALAGIAPAACADDAEASPYSDFLKYQSYRLTLKWQGGENGMHTRSLDDCVYQETLQSSLSASVSLKLTLEEDSDPRDTYLWATGEEEPPEGNISYQGSFKDSSECNSSSYEKSGMTSHNLSGGGLSESEGRFEIDTQSGEFRIHGYATAANMRISMISTAGINSSVDSPNGLSLGPGQAGEDIVGQLPKSGSQLQGGPIDVPLGFGPWFAQQPLKLTWTLVPWEARKGPEVVVEPDIDYAEWLPKGDLNQPKEPGNKLTVYVRVHKKGDPSTPDKAKISFSLPYVSEEKGVCMNWPKEGAVVQKGLQLRQEDQTEPKERLLVRDNAHAETPGEVQDVVLVVGSYDFGAWGTLRVTGVKQGKELQVKVRGKASPDLDIPLDEDSNRIADHWRHDQTYGQPGDADEEQTPGNDHLGDGLTLFEEYRGFVVKGAHEQAEPGKRDLFICDNTSGKKAGPGIDLFEKASKLKVWRIDANEFNTDRVVNFIHVEGPHHVDQHGILIQDAASDQANDPETISSLDGDGDKPFGPPRLTKYIQIPTHGDYITGDGPIDVAHELGHAVGLQHHGDGATFPEFWFWEQDAEGNWQLYERDVEIEPDGGLQQKGAPRPIQVFYEPAKGSSATKPVEPGMDFTGLPGFPNRSGTKHGWLLQLYTQGGEWSGDEECFMRYEDKQAFFQLNGAESTHRYLVDAKQNRTRTKFCTTKEGHYVNADDHNPFSRGGKEASRGECFKHIVINDESDPNP